MRKTLMTASVAVVFTATLHSVIPDVSAESADVTSIKALERSRHYLQDESAMGPARHFMSASAGTALSTEMIAEFRSLILAEQAVLNHEEGFDSDPSRSTVTWNGSGFDVSESGNRDSATIQINGFQSPVGTPVSGWCNGNAESGFDTPKNKENALKSCYQKYKVADGSEDEDLWAYTRWVEADPLDNGGFFSQSAAVKTLYAYSRVTQGSAWKVRRRFDVNPSADGNKGCDNVPITVVLGVVEVGQNLTWCDDWDVRSWGEEGELSAKYRNEFRASGKMAFLGRRAGRFQEVGFTNAVWVDSGTQPFFFDYSSATICQYYDLTGWQDCHYDNWSE